MVVNKVQGFHVMTVRIFTNFVPRLVETCYFYAIAKQNFFFKFFKVGMICVEVRAEGTIFRGHRLYQYDLHSVLPDT
jgi:hypothetical protein